MKKKIALPAAPAPLPEINELAEFLDSIPMQGDASPKPDFLIDSPRNRMAFPWLKLDRYMYHAIGLDFGVAEYAKANFARRVSPENHPDIPAEYFDANGFFRVGTKREAVLLYSDREMANRVYSAQLEARTLATHNPLVSVTPGQKV